MPRFGFVGASYKSQSLNADAQTTMNWYPEIDESQAGNAPIVMYPTPGLEEFAELVPVPLNQDLYTTSTGSDEHITTDSIGPAGPNEFAVFAAWANGASGGLTEGGSWTPIAAGTHNNPYAYGGFYQIASSALAGDASASASPIYGTQALLGLLGCTGVPALVQQKLGQGVSSQNFDSPVTPGNAVILLIWFYGFSGALPFTAAPSDGGSDVFSLGASVEGGTNPVSQVMMYVARNSAGGFSDVDCNPSASTAINMQILEVSGL